MSVYDVPDGDWIDGLPERLLRTFQASRNHETMREIASELNVSIATAGHYKVALWNYFVQVYDKKLSVDLEQRVWEIINNSIKSMRDLEFVMLKKVSKAGREWQKAYVVKQEDFIRLDGSILLVRWYGEYYVNRY